MALWVKVVATTGPDELADFEERTFRQWDRASLSAAAKRAKVAPELHQHDLRHRCVTVWLAEGRDVVKVKEAMGHADLRTTMEYTHLAREHLSALIEEKTGSCG